MVGIGFDEVFPLWALSTPSAGGLGWGTHQIGKASLLGIVGAQCRSVYTFQRAGEAVLQMQYPTPRYVMGGILCAAHGVVGSGWSVPVVLAPFYFSYLLVISLLPFLTDRKCKAAMSVQLL